MSQLLTSRRLWTLILDVVVSSIIYAVSHFGSAQAQEFAKFVIVTIQPVAIFLIGALTVDDVKKNGETIKASRDIQTAAINAGTHPDYPPCPPITLDDISAKPMTAAEQHQADSIRQAYGEKKP